MIKKILATSIAVALLFFGLAGQAQATKKGLDEILNVTRCTYQWDFMLYVFAERGQKMKKTTARENLMKQWVRPGAKKEFNEVSTDAINSAVEYVYGLNPMPEKSNKVLASIHKGFMQCVKERKLKKFRRELITASSRAGLVTLWDYYHHQGITKEQILKNSKKMSKFSRKILDDVYSPKFNAQRYRIYDIWNPVTAYIAHKYHGVTIEQPKPK